MGSVVTHMTLPSGEKVQLMDWISQPMYSTVRFATLLIRVDGSVLVDTGRDLVVDVRGQGVIKDDEVVDEVLKPEIVPIEQWAQEQGFSLWSLFCCLNELRAERSKAARRRPARWRELRVERRLRRKFGLHDVLDERSAV